MPGPFDFKEDDPLVTRRPRPQPAGWWPILALFVVVAVLAAGVGFWAYQDHQRKEMERLYFQYALQEAAWNGVMQIDASHPSMARFRAEMSRLNQESMDRFGAICPALPLPETTKTAILMRVQLRR